jgi:glycerol uptake operon antiterminator
MMTRFSGDSFYLGAFSYYCLRLIGRVLNILDIAGELKAMGKIVFVNIAMVDGFSRKNSVIDFLKKNLNVGGLISTKPQILRYAKRLKLFAIHRFFSLDSSSWWNITSQLKISCADFINITPGWTKLIKWTVEKYDTPVIAS